MADTTRPNPRDDWGASWEARRRDQLTIGLQATPAQRLEWLVSMIELAWRTGALPRKDRRRTADPET